MCWTREPPLSLYHYQLQHNTQQIPRLKGCCWQNSACNWTSGGRHVVVIAVRRRTSAKLTTNWRRERRIAAADTWTEWSHLFWIIGQINRSINWIAEHNSWSHSKYEDAYQLRTQTSIQIVDFHITPTKITGAAMKFVFHFLTRRVFSSPIVAGASFCELPNIPVVTPTRLLANF